MEFLSQHKIAYTEKNVRADEDALNELFALNSQSTPTLVIGGEVLVGFEPERILKLVQG